MKEDTGKILVSGIQPTGRPHIGNYFGAMKQFVDLQDSYESYIFIADYHALTTLHDREELSRNIFDIAVDYLAIGLDPVKTALYRQSQIPEVTELAWIFDCLTTMPYLERAHAYKDKIAQGKEASAGLATYPMLMAADILIMSAGVVPVGRDQKQHIEYARDTAQKFNAAYGNVFIEPKDLILDAVETVPGTDGRKMSKSYGNTIPLFAEEDELRKTIMGIVTDSKGVEESKDPETDNVFALHKLVTPADALETLADRYRNGGIGYKESKELLFENMNAFLAPLREKRNEIAHDRDRVLSILEEGGKRAHQRAERKMVEVRESVGLTL